MSANLPITWNDKVNSPELKAFLAQYGPELCFSAEEMNQLRDAVNEMALIQQSTFLGAAEPTSTPAGTGRAYWIAITPGTYTNFGGVVIAANTIAFIIRDAAGLFTATKSGLNLTEYQKIVDGNKINPWTAKAYLLGDQVNYLGKDWVSNAATVAVDVPGASNKWLERLTASIRAQLNYLADNAVFDIFYNRIIADGGTIENTSQLLSMLAYLRSISYVPKSYIQQMNADKFVKLGGTANQYLMADGSTTTTQQGLDLARMKTSQINEIVDPVQGLIVFNTDLKAVCFFTTSWQKVSSTTM